MNRVYIVALSGLIAACTASFQNSENGSPREAAFRLNNGVWFNGNTFTQARFDVIDGKLQEVDLQRPVAKEIDLDGGFVVPPFCEAHNHNLGDSADPEDIDATVQSYLKYGVFYAMMQGSFARYRKVLEGRVNIPQSVDVAFANNGITGAGGHPIALREFLHERYGSYPEFTLSTLEDSGYFEVESASQLKQKFEKIRSQQPDFIKVMLLFSEEYEKRKDDEQFYGKRGLNPDLLPELVEMAHIAGLRVSVHVETDHDMATALQAGADIIAHLPSHDAAVLLSDTTIALATKNNTALITTLSLAQRLREKDPDGYEKVRQTQVSNLTRLHDGGANLVIGSDNFRDVSLGEVLYLDQLDVFSNAELLRMWTQACAATVFPDRKIGRLESGFDASFLVLESDPLKALNNVKKIRMGMKEGQFLTVFDMPKENPNSRE